MRSANVSTRRSTKLAAEFAAHNVISSKAVVLSSSNGDSRKPPTIIELQNAERGDGPGRHRDHAVDETILDDAREHVDRHPRGGQVDRDAKQISAWVLQIGAQRDADRQQYEDEGDRAHMGDDAAHRHAQDRRPVDGQRDKIGPFADRRGNAGGDDDGQCNQSELYRQPYRGELGTQRMVRGLEKCR